MAFITQMQVGFAFRVSRTLGPLYKVLMLNCKDFFIWLTMFLITLAMFAVIGVLVGVQSIDHPCRTYKDCIIMFFQASLGQMSFAEQVNLATSQFILVLCIIINMVLLLSILIAMLTKTYDLINSRAKLYYMKEVFNLVESRKVDSKYGAFVSLDFPLTIFPGLLILLLLYCFNRRANLETRAELRKIKKKQADTLNKCAMRFPAYAVSWIILSIGIVFVNLVVSPLIWVLICYNQFKILNETPNLKVQTNQDQESSTLNPQVIDHVPRNAVILDNKKNVSQQRSKRFFSFTIWILLFGFPLVLLHIIYHVAIFCANLCQSQKSIIRKEGSPDLKNFERHQMTFDLIMEPQPVATLATLAYEELSNNYSKLNKKRPLHVLTEQEVVNRNNTLETYTIKVAHAKTKAAIDFSENKMKKLTDMGLGKMDWEDQKKSLDDNPNTILVKQFYRKFRRQLKSKLKAKKVSKEQKTLMPNIVKRKSTTYRDQFYSRTISAVPREAQNEAADILHQNEVFKRLLMHFSVRKSVIEDIEENLQSLSVLQIQTSNTLATEQSASENEHKIVSSHFLYLDSFVGIYSTMLVYSKLQKFSRHPSQIPPSVLTNFADLLAREEYNESLHSGREIDFSPISRSNTRKFNDMSGLNQNNLLNIDTQQYNLLTPKTQGKMKRLPSALRFQESSYIKKHQIESLFYIFNLKRLNGALRGLNSKRYRRLDLKGEIGKCARDIKELKLNEKLKQQSLARKAKQIQTSKFSFEKMIKPFTTKKSMFRTKTKMNKLDIPPVIGESQLEEQMPSLQTEKLSDQFRNLFPPTEREMEVMHTEDSQAEEEVKDINAVDNELIKQDTSEAEKEQEKQQKKSSERVGNVQQDDDLILAVPSPFQEVLQQRPFTAGEILSQTERASHVLQRTANELNLSRKLKEKKDSIQDRKEAWGAMFEIGESDQERQNTVQSGLQIFSDTESPPKEGRNSLN